MSLIFDDVRFDLRQIPDLMADRMGICSRESCSAPPTIVRVSLLWRKYCFIKQNDELGLFFLFLMFATILDISAQKPIVGAERTWEYIPKLRNKKVGLVVNQTSVIGKTHLVDTLIKLNIAIQSIFAPEHGFRGTADAGAHIDNSVDSKTRLPSLSLYGSKHAPSDADLKGMDVLVFDIQDVGCRFYTFISTLHYVMEACAKNHVELIVIDRPNPNGMYVDGPVLQKGFESFVSGRRAA